ncbi:MAG TPA: NADH:ubiquinone reductase (Na(+)-transporting) subunit D [Planctomycetota bacterium]|nr:NADH:ubiquinone reductase (Na(+)-transporting) subunit D [Planctomycetota bacterium]
MSLFCAEDWEKFSENIWKENPVFRQILGVCSALAVTNLMMNSLVMGVALIFVVVCSNVIVSCLRHWIPNRIRMISQVLIIAVFVTIVDLLLQAFMYDVSKQLGAYIGLIITNCIVMGRAEAFAMKNGPVASFFDGLGAGLGYTIVLLAIAVPRELLGFGTLFGIPVIFSESWIAWNVMIMPPGAFIVLGIFIWIVNSISKNKISS